MSPTSPRANESTDVGHAARRSRLHQVLVASVAALVGVLLTGVAAVAVTWFAPAHVAARIIEPVAGLYAGNPQLPEQLEAPAERSTLHAADGSKLTTLFRDENRVVVDFDHLPDHLIHAVIATEDHLFYDHPGINHRAIIRAAVTNWRSETVEEGGSTITQQLIKNVITGDDVTLRRKAEETNLALQLERRDRKNEILEAYLNEVYLGEGSYGVAAAAELYFNTDVDDLDVSQAATLAGMIRSPERINPAQSIPEATRMRDTVIDQMLEHDLIDRATAAEATSREVAVDINRPDTAYDEPFFVAYVIDHLLSSDVLGTDEQQRRRRLYAGGLEIVTTLDRDLQAVADATIRDTLTDPVDGPQATIVSVTPGDGGVAALGVGPRAWGDCDDATDETDGGCERTRVNPAAPGLGGAGRQAGSAFKPFVAAAALREGVGTGWQDSADSGEMVPGCDDADGAYEPSNYGDATPGVISAAEAMRDSNNVFHVKLAELSGTAAMLDIAEDTGLRSGELPNRCATALGAGSVWPLEMAAAYATFAAEGVSCTPYPVRSITDRDGTTIYRAEADCRAALDADVAAHLTGMLTDVVENGTGRRAAVDGIEVAGKTGTTDDAEDAWFVGSTGGDQPATTAVWLGHEEPEPLADIAGEATITGGSVPADLFASYHHDALEFGYGGDMTVEPPPQRSYEIADFVGHDIDAVLDEAGDVPSAADPGLLEQIISGDPHTGAGPTAEETLVAGNGDTRHAHVDDYGLHIATLDVTHWADAGEVIAQSRDPGGDVPAGRMLVLAVSDGQGDPPEVPDVVGLSDTAATETLEERGYVVDVGEDERMVAIEPVESELWDPEDRDESDEEALLEAAERATTLADLGDLFAVIDADDARFDTGDVIEQTPRAGQPLEPGGTVDLRVAALEFELELPPPPPPEPDDAGEEDDRDEQDRNRGEGGD